MKNFKLTKRIASIYLLSTTITLSSLSGCVKKMDCDIQYDHAHKYVSDEGFYMYKDSEYETKDGMSWTNNITYLNNEIETLDKFDLLKIDDNIEALEEDTSTDKNHSGLTSKVRDVNYKYRAYKIVTTKKGKQKIEESELVDDITTIKDEYPYFKLSDYKEKVYSKQYELGKIMKKKIKQRRVNHTLFYY